MPKIDLYFGGITEVPKEIAECPECQGRLEAECYEWVTKEGTPARGGINLYCELEERYPHNWCLDRDWETHS